jgi:Phosphate transporter family
MSLLTLGLLVALFLVLYAEFINGWTDAPNAIATVVSTGVMSPRNAVIMAVVLNFFGALAGTAVAATVGKGIVESKFLTLPAISAAMIAIIVWGTFAARVGLPIKIACVVGRPCWGRLCRWRIGGPASQWLDQSLYRHVLRGALRLLRFHHVGQADYSSCRSLAPDPR